MAEGLVFDIQGFSVHDGPGCRTLVFLSGCPLRCAWCANPEGLQARPRLRLRRSRCDCVEPRCAQACPRRAISPAEGGSVTVDRSLCADCASFDCAEACCRDAFLVCGKRFTLEELMKVLRRDSSFWGQHGGVTLGGGDPAAQLDFAREVLASCEAEGLHTAVETSAHAPAEAFLGLMRHARWAFIDLKHMDPEKHAQGTGVDNRLILDNIRALRRTAWPGTLMPRIPLVPGFNDDPENLRRSAEFLAGLGLREAQALPFHRLGASKYGQLGLEWSFSEQAAPTSQDMTRVKEIFASAGVLCHLGADTPF